MGDKFAFEVSRSQPVSLAAKMLTSNAFLALFREGMALVEATAAYLDGDGRTQSRELERMAALTYASESMRLTTRLMQMTSWLLLQRAVNEGELSSDEAAEEHRKVKLRPQDNITSQDNLALLPLPLQDLINRSMRLQSRILKLDGFTAGDTTQDASIMRNGVADQLSALQSALGARSVG